MRTHACNTTSRKALGLRHESDSVPVDGLCLLLHEALPEAEDTADQARPAAATEGFSKRCSANTR